MEKKERVQLPKRALVFSGRGQVTGNKISIKASSGRPFKHPYWQKLCLDLSGMVVEKARLPILMAHDTAKPIGFFDRDDVTVNGGVNIEGQLIDSQAAREFVGQVGAGVPFEASVYGVPSRIERVEEGGETEVNGIAFEGPGSIFRAWALREASPCIFGADSGTSVDVFSFADSEKMIDVELDGQSEDDALASELFALSTGGHIHKTEDISDEDAALADELFQASGGQV